MRISHDLQPQGARRGGLFVPPELPLDPGDVSKMAESASRVAHLTS